MKGCAIFAGLFLLGVALVVSGAIYEIVVSQNLETRALPARVLELSGVIVAFGTIFGAAGWTFYRRVQEERAEKEAETNKLRSVPRPRDEDQNT